MKTIILLTEDASNLSVSLIDKAIAEQCQKSNIPLNSLVIEKKVGDGLTLDCDALIKTSQGLFPTLLITLNDIAFVMVRTWTNKREPVIALAEDLKERGISVSDSELMPWTLSKVAQYYSLQDNNVFPESVCLDESWMASYEMRDKEVVVQQVKKDVEKLGYPLVIKASRGSRGTGVYRAKDEESFTQFLSYYLWGSNMTQTKTRRYGLIFQKFIHPFDTSISLERSIYLRLNIVNQRISSVVQFELEWQPVVLDAESNCYEKIQGEILGSGDEPIALTSPLIEWYEDLLPLLPFPLGVVGLDLMKDEHGNYFLLEVNCSPNVSLIEKLGKMSPEIEAGKRCLEFSSQIANFCIQQAFENKKIMQKDGDDAAVMSPPK
tara:strand:- start:1073 stop:2206 length:1134 start_codon:yes stop_codon:yes gene_type:complete